MEISAGKLWCFRRLADKNGLFKMTAVDQRPPIMNVIKEKLKVDEASYEDISRIKTLLTKTLAQHSSAMLLDPIWAYSDAIEHVEPSQGLLITLEAHDFEEAPGGRKSSEIADWNVEKIKRLGADGVKVLAWYRPDADPAICQYQQDMVEAIGKACQKHDICFLFELLVYPLEGDAHQTKEYVETQSKRPELVIDSVKAFSDSKFGIDIFKLESPIPASEVPDPNSKEAAECQEWFNQLGQACDVPWVMLSAGADMDAFEKVLTYAYQAGASGYLAGRAIWWKAAQNFPDLQKMEAELNEEGVAYIKKIGQLTDTRATPWFKHKQFAQGYQITGAGQNFPANY
jgi:tagatose 1,6-diphosphate aldolase